MTDEIKRRGRENNRHKLICQGVNLMFQIFFTDRDEIAYYREFCAHVDRV